GFAAVGRQYLDLNATAGQQQHALTGLGGEVDDFMAGKSAQYGPLFEALLLGSSQALEEGTLLEEPDLFAHRRPWHAGRAGKHPMIRLGRSLRLWGRRVG